MNAEFQRIARRDEKAFLSDQCKEREENNRMGRLEISSRKFEEVGNISCKGRHNKGQKWYGPNRSWKWRRKWQPTPVFFLENPMDRRAWWAAVYGVAESWTGLSTAVLGRHCIAFCIPRQTVFPHEHFSIAELVQRVRQSRENAVSGINRLGVESSSASSLIAVDFP